MIIIISIITLLLFYYFQDKIREPAIKIIEVFLLGIVMVFQVNFLQDKLLQFSLSYIYQSFVVAAAVEELIKWFTIKLTIFRDKEFSSWMDGVVYCVALGLGFGLVESLVLHDDSLSRAITSIPMHSLVGVTMGYYLGLYKSKGKRFDMTASIVLPILLHGIYNYTIYINNPYLFGVYFIGLWIVATYLLNKIKKGE